MLAIPDGSVGGSFPAIAMYPSGAPETEQLLGPYTMQLAMDAECAGSDLPLVLISHGTGSTPLVYRNLAAHLARRGYFVVSVEHPGNNRKDNSRAGTVWNLTERPHHLRQAADFLLGESPFAADLRPDAFAVIGHSMGGYTALALAGGRPTASGHETGDGVPRLLEMTVDHRVKALVLLAPAAAWFMAAGSLSEVRVPILMMTAEKDEHAHEFHGELIKDRLPEDTPIEHRVIANAGHFCFLSPFPASMARPGFAPAQDPDGFDRVAFQQEMQAEILRFLRQHL